MNKSLERFEQDCRWILHIAGLLTIVAVVVATYAASTNLAVFL
jgi:hypothetical protein